VKETSVNPVPFDETVGAEERTAAGTISVSQKNNLYRPAVRNSDYVSAGYTNYFPYLLLSNLKLISKHPRLRKNTLI
jgi:hypothetical protein